VDTSLRNPGASAVIYGGVEAVVFDGVDEALRVPAPTCACSASPRALPSAAWAWRWRARRCGTARSNAKLAAGKVKPRKA
jgi:phosphoribosylglycinamide formyltransferase 2